MIKTFEQFNELDPYGEEDWDDKETFDLSGYNLDGVVDELNDLLSTRTKLGFVPLNFHYTKMVVIEGNDDGSDYEEGPGEAVEHINYVFLGEDGDIIINGTQFEYIGETDDYINHEIFYTLDTNHPIKMGDKMEIKI